jgi:O-antigen ligase
VAAVIAILLAWRSVAYPLALAGIPTLIDAVVGSNPFPKGLVTFLLAAWIGLGIIFALMREDHGLGGRVLLSAPVALSLVFLGLMILRLGPSPDEAYGSVKVQLYVADDLMFLIGALFVGSRRSELRRFLLLTLAITAGGALLLLFELLSGSAKAVVGERFSLTPQEYPIALARSSADGILIAIYAVLAASRASVRLWALAVLPVLVVAMLAAGSRGPVLAFLFGLIALIALTAAGGRARRRLLLVGAGLLVATVIVPLVVPGSALGRALSAIVGGASGLSTNGRAHLWSQAFTAFAEHPLLGIGTGGFAALSAETYPHNILLESACELGLVGALVMLGILGSSLSRLIRLWRSAPGAQALDAGLLIALFLSALINALFSGAIQDNQGIWIWAGLGLAMSARIASQASLLAPRARTQANPAPIAARLARPRSIRSRGLRAQ